MGKMMALLNDLLNTLLERKVSQVVIGLHWTAVVTEFEGGRRCGLASTFAGENDHHQHADVPNAGQLEKENSLILAGFAQSELPVLRSLGIAAINSLLPSRLSSSVEHNAEVMIAQHGKGKNVVLVGRFPFIPRLRSQLENLVVLETEPKPGELPPSSAHEVIPNADVVAITGMSLINRTFDSLIELCAPHAFVIVIGPSTPLSPVMFDHGVDLLCGSEVTAVEPVLRAVRQAANFRQVHQAGVRLICMDSKAKVS
jgi:uncharacterized protein (DUF4213/DUF364 family)